MKARKIILSIAVAAAIAAPTALLAQGGPGMGPGAGHGRHGGHMGGFNDGAGPGFLEHMLPRLAERLTLSDEQVAEIESILDEARPTIEAYAEKIRAGREAYRAAQSDPTTFDEGAFRAHAAEQSRLRTEQMVAAQDAKARALAVLSPEQLAELEAMRGEAGKRHMRRPGGRRSN
ncbi:MAG TPA: Spy/CpxP family protein refolding chaperone [Chondromyces sp.]|nr:Spy/CpxP family protein refolding chaperone [Chondromyces sp.]